jgi:hypothetical protein
MSNPVALTSLARELATLTGKPVPSYRALWEAVVNDQVRATQKKGRYYVDPMEAAADLGLVVPAASRRAA